MNCPNRNNFCYVCGLFAPQTHMRSITKNTVMAFEACFFISYVLNLWYTPETVCDYCYRYLNGLKSKFRTFKYIAPTIWLRRTEHAIDACYFCLTKTSGFRYNIREKINYANVQSVISANIRSDDTTAMELDILEDKEPGPPSPLTTISYSELESEFIATQSELGYKCSKN